MHHWVKYCVNRCMTSEVIALTSFCIATKKRPRKVGQCRSRSFIFELFSRIWCGASLVQIVCKSVKEIFSYCANEILHCYLANTYKSSSKVGQDHSSWNPSKAMVICITGSNIV